MISSSYLQTGFNLVSVAGTQKLIFAQKRLGAIKLQLNHNGHVTSQKVTFSSFRAINSKSTIKAKKHKLPPPHQPPLPKTFPSFRQATSPISIQKTMSLNHSEQFYWLDPLGVGASRVRKVRHKYNSQVRNSHLEKVF